MRKRTKSDGAMSYDEILKAMRYLGYNMTPQAERTASALAGKVVYGVMLPSQIATEYAKHNNLVLPGEKQPV